MSTLQGTCIMILGGGGDLAQRKLLPALFDLYAHELLSSKFTIIGLARTERTDETYQAFVKEAVHRARPMESHERIDSFVTHVRYVSGSFTEAKSYESLKDQITVFENSIGMPSNRLFYLAVPPQHYGEIFTMLHTSEIAKKRDKALSWSRILVEKPFGNDYQTAEALDKTLGSLFAEEQIFRIDHYLAKEAVQNILSFRFANVLTSSAWDSKHIKEVRIIMHEKLDVGNRGSFYDAVGALRDVGQNHMLQILALIAMREPAHLTATEIRTNRAEVLEKLVPFTDETINTQFVRAQYEGYTGVPGVLSDSDTETYFEFKAFINDPQWEGVPFIVSAGKALREAVVCVHIAFHDVATGPFETSASSSVGNNIRLDISPEHGMHITLNMKRPGHGYTIESHTLSYAWEQGEAMPIDAYEKVLLDCIEGDQTLFTETREVLASWKFITSILERIRQVPLQNYKKEASGPDQTLLSIA